MSTTCCHRTAIRYRCRACGCTFTDTLAGVVACPRCSAIADHEQLGRALTEQP